MRGALLLAIFLTVCGCQSARVRAPLTATLAANDSHTRSEFWYQFARQPVTSNDDAFHGLLMYLDGEDPAADYPARVRALQGRGMLGGTFHGSPDQAIDRGTLAVALVHLLKIEGGVTMHLLGPVPRYAVRALESRGLYPPGSPNQTLTGGEFVGIMEKAEEYERGTPAEAPAAVLPGEIRRPGGPLASAAARNNVTNVATASASNDPNNLASPLYFDVFISPAGLLDADPEPGSFLRRPHFLADLPTPATTPSGARRLNVIVTGVEGDSAEFRKDADSPWTKARVGTVLHENAEFRTGPKSAVRFIIPPNQTFCLDSQGATTVLAALADEKAEKTDIGLAHGRVRYDLARTVSAAGQAMKIEEAGIEHDATIRGPNSALALRGTMVSLFEQPSFVPEAVSLVGQATYINPRGDRVAFGGSARATVTGNQTSAADQAADRSVPGDASYLSRAEFEAHEVFVSIQRGGFMAGDVIVGDLHLTDFAKLPGALDFVLQWNGGPQRTLNDLNLAVFSPLHTSGSPDFVANPPFTVSLTPNDPASQKLRATNYPKNSRSGGQISGNSVGPNGLEIASWPKNYPAGAYRVNVFNLIDAATPPTQTINPVSYTIDVFLNGKKLVDQQTGSVGVGQISPGLLITVPGSASSAAQVAAVSNKAGIVKQQVAQRVINSPVVRAQR